MATVAITPDHNTVTGEIFIDAPPERVFEALTDPTQMPKWWGQEGIYKVTEATADLRQGGKWSSVGVAADGSKFRVDGEYVEVDPPRLLVQTWRASWTEQLNTVVRWELEPQAMHGLHASGPRKAGTGTLVKLRHEGFAGVVTAATGHAEGWKRVLSWLHAFLEKGETFDTRKTA